ncbi:MAG TPA: hypothetical protein VIZ61_04925 [Solirubrobacterales bacterium]
MQEHSVHLLRIEGTADEECEEFLKCLYDRIEFGPPEQREPDQAGTRELHLAAPGDIQPVPITGDFGLEAAHAQVDELATACRPDWETLYQLVR